MVGGTSDSSGTSVRRLWLLRRGALTRYAIAAITTMANTTMAMDVPNVMSAILRHNAEKGVGESLTLL